MKYFHNDFILQWTLKSKTSFQIRDKILRLFLAKTENTTSGHQTLEMFNCKHFEASQNENRLIDLSRN